MSENGRNIVKVSYGEDSAESLPFSRFSPEDKNRIEIACRNSFGKNLDIIVRGGQEMADGNNKGVDYFMDILPEFMESTLRSILFNLVVREFSKRGWYFDETTIFQGELSDEQIAVLREIYQKAFDSCLDSSGIKSKILKAYNDIKEKEETTIRGKVYEHVSKNYPGLPKSYVDNLYNESVFETKLLLELFGRMFIFNKGGNIKKSFSDLVVKKISDKISESLKDA